MWQQYTVLEDMPRTEFAHCPHQVRPFHDEAHHLCLGFRAQLAAASSVLSSRTRKRESSTSCVESNSPRSAIALRSEEKMTRRLQHSSFAPARCKITAAAGACHSKRSRVWSPGEVPLDVKSSVAQPLVCSRKKHLRSAGSLQHFPVESRARREQRCDVCHCHLNNHDAGDAHLRGAPRRSADVPIDELQWCFSGTAATAAPPTPGVALPWLADDLVNKNVQSTPTLSQNSNRRRSPSKLQRPDQLHNNIKLQPEDPEST